MSDEMKELLSGPVVKAEEPAVNGEVSQHSNTGIECFLSNLL